MASESSLDTYLELFTGEQDPITEDDDSGDNYDARIRWQLNAGTYLIRVHPLASDPMPSNRYILTVTKE
jgi:hypothetical protein